MTKPRLALAAACLAGLLTLTGCGGSEADPAGTEGAGDSGTTATEPAPTSLPSSRPGGLASGLPGGLDGEQLAEIRECLEAAGLEDRMPSGGPSGMPSERPTEMPTGAPSGIPSGAPEGGLGALQDPDVQEALDACGIERPEPPGRE